MKKDIYSKKSLFFWGILLFMPLLIPAKAILYNLLDDGDGKISPLKKIKIKKIDEETPISYHEIIPSLKKRPEKNQVQSVKIKVINATYWSKEDIFIRDITYEIKERDGVWSKKIDSEGYIRITFEKNLTNKNDIRVFPKIVSGNPSIEVYDLSKNNLIANFTSVSEKEYNSVFLTNLSEEQDTFYLHIIGGSVQFDHIVDPIPVSLLQATIVNYNFTTNLSDRNAYRFYPTASQTFNGTAGANSVYGNYSTTNYTAIQTRDGTAAQIWARGANDFPAHRFNFTAKELGGQNRSWIQWLTVNVTVFDNASEVGTVNLWNFTDGANFSIGQTPSSNGNVSYNASSGAEAIKFIQSSSNNITVYVQGGAYDAIDGIFVDFVQVDVMYLKDVEPPQWSGNQTNSTVAGSTVLHSVLWSDETPINTSIFSLDNGNGSYLNYTLAAVDNSNNWTNFSYVVNSTAGVNIRWRVYTNDSWMAGNNLNVSYGEYTTTFPPADSCTCTDGVDWTIINGDQCILTTTCNLGTGRLRIMDGALRIANTGILNSNGCFVGNGESFYIENGGRLICR